MRVPRCFAIAGFLVSCLANFLEIAVPAEAVLEATRTRYAVFDESLTPVVPLLNQGLTNV